ncbi:hypothetical protein JZ751_024351 [Albula glossodonta]|uniref:Uncharacterized protein n=1 Tax=Albula glossodonta TaxID=121402 RepID=A0A8T2NJ20_9TELE|nr:hypothetical protein JZ751_024351 [Albula glossodonta]
MLRPSPPPRGVVSSIMAESLPLWLELNCELQVDWRPLEASRPRRLSLSRSPLSFPLEWASVSSMLGPEELLALDTPPTTLPLFRLVSEEEESPLRPGEPAPCPTSSSAPSTPPRECSYSSNH